MSGRPQQPELARSQQTPIDPSQRAAQSKDEEVPPEDRSRGAVPPENQPGHDHGDDPDKPSPERFRKRAQGEQ